MVKASGRCSCRGGWRGHPAPSWSARCWWCPVCRDGDRIHRGPAPAAVALVNQIERVARVLVQSTELGLREDVPQKRRATRASPVPVWPHVWLRRQRRPRDARTLRGIHRHPLERVLAAAGQPESPQPPWPSSSSAAPTGILSTSMSAGAGTVRRTPGSDAGALRRLLEKNSLAAARPGKGRFRSFLLGTLKHLLADEHAKAQAKKRGGGHVLVSWEQPPRKPSSARNRWMRRRPTDSLTGAGR